MRHILKVILLLIIVSCKTETKIEKAETKTLDNGTYRAELKVNDTEVLPFNFKVLAEDSIEIYNAEEVITIDNIKYHNDSIIIQTPVFEGKLVAKVENNKLNGSFIVEGKGRKQTLKAVKKETRFDITKKAEVNITGNWETLFSPNTPVDRYIAKGIFKQKGNQVTGTFRTETGDYRFLEGVINGNELKLSTFDGAHAFLFTGLVTDSTMQGTFYSGNHWKEPFVAKRNANYELPSAESLTFLKEGYDALSFTFPDANGNQVSLSDKRFKNKVVLVQIMGTWCPNCLDETKYYSQFYQDYKDKGLEIIALAFEYAKTEEKAFAAIKRLQDKVAIEYPILLAQTGTTSKLKAQEKLPMLNHVLSYPTTVFVDKKGKVSKIHTGFNGPATGNKFEEFKTELTQYVDTLLLE